MTFYTSGAPDLTLADPPTAVTLLSMAQGVMGMVEQAAAGRGVQLPERRVVYMAPIPADCPQVAVLIGGWNLEPASDEMLICTRGRWVARLGVGITRKTPAIPSAAGDLPTPAQLFAAAALAAEDAEVLLEVVGSLGEIGGDAAVDTPAAEGGLQSVTLTVRTPAFGGI